MMDCRLMLIFFRLQSHKCHGKSMVILAMMCISNAKRTEKASHGIIKMQYNIISQMSSVVCTYWRSVGLGQTGIWCS
uniref:Uncharacterized protein n=1 Tax=Anguilla anguilla TaxID=7936 RepID=A0A0E9WMD1_ANGAN